MYTDNELSMAEDTPPCTCTVYMYMCTCIQTIVLFSMPEDTPTCYSTCITNTYAHTLYTCIYMYTMSVVILYWQRGGDAFMLGSGGAWRKKINIHVHTDNT